MMTKKDSEFDEKMKATKLIANEKNRNHDNNNE